MLLFSAVFLFKIQYDIRKKSQLELKSKKRGKSQYIEKKYVALLRLDIKPRHIQYLIGFSFTGTSAVVWSETF